MTDKEWAFDKMAKWPKETWDYYVLARKRQSHVPAWLEGDGRSFKIDASFFDEIGKYRNGSA